MSWSSVTIMLLIACSVFSSTVFADGLKPTNEGVFEMLQPLSKDPIKGVEALVLVEKTTSHKTTRSKLDSRADHSPSFGGAIVDLSHSLGGDDAAKAKVTDNSFAAYQPVFGKVSTCKSCNGHKLKNEVGWRS